MQPVQYSKYSVHMLVESSSPERVQSEICMKTLTRGLSDMGRRRGRGAAGATPPKAAVTREATVQRRQEDKTISSVFPLSRPEKAIVWFKKRREFPLKTLLDGVEAPKRSKRQLCRPFFHSFQTAKVGPGP